MDEIWIFDAGNSFISINSILYHSYDLHEYHEKYKLFCNPSNFNQKHENYLQNEIIT